MRARVLLMATITALLGACASVPRQPPPNPRLLQVESVAGKRVNSFNVISSLYSWEPIGDQYVLLYTRPRQAFLLQVVPCPDMSSAVTLGVTSRFGNVTSGLDSVVAGSLGALTYPCRIQTIRAVDVKALRAAEKADAKTVKPHPVKVLPRPAAQKPTGQESGP